MPLLGKRAHIARTNPLPCLPSRRPRTRLFDFHPARAGLPNPRRAPPLVAVAKEFAMATGATLYKARLDVSDIDRGYYANHAFVMARHPSETFDRLVVRLLAFVLHAHEDLAFGAGLSSDDEPDLWRRSPTGEIECWIDLGQPDEARIRRACARARAVVVVNYGGRAADIWWDKCGAALARFEKLTVIDIGAEAVSALAALSETGGRKLEWQCVLQEGELQIVGPAAELALVPRLRMGVAAGT